MNAPANSRVIKPGRSETPFLLFTGNRKAIVRAARGIDFNRLAPLLVGIAAAVIFLIIHAFFSGKLS